ncbi:MAG TPA: hypothetical protein VK809_12950, partial [Bacteroidia bacterium]|nr:hypothetical protein [Bacteroidia bacterium]
MEFTESTYRKSSKPLVRETAAKDSFFAPKATVQKKEGSVSDVPPVDKCKGKFKTIKINLHFNMASNDLNKENIELKKQTAQKIANQCCVKLEFTTPKSKEHLALSSNPGGLTERNDKDITKLGQFEYSEELRKFGSDKALKKDDGVPVIFVEDIT